MDRRRITFLFAGISILFIVLYGGWEARYAVLGPRFTIHTPKDGEVFLVPLITVSGKTANTARLSVNDREIFTNEDGTFSESLLLGPGHTIIEIRAEDRFGKERTILKEVFLKTPARAEPPTATTTESKSGATTSPESTN